MVAKQWSATDLVVVERAGESGDLSAVLVDEGKEFIVRRVKARKLMREFLRAVPRTEPDATLAFVRPDGATRVIKRAELTEAIEHQLRPRMKQIIKLGVEERWPRAKVCEHQHDISMKTYERDQVEALDILIEL